MQILGVDGSMPQKFSGVLEVRLTFLVNARNIKVLVQASKNQYFVGRPRIVA
jgi:hypothetical protein